MGTPSISGWVEIVFRGTSMNILIRVDLAYLIMTSIQLTRKPSRGGRQVTSLPKAF